MKKINIILLVAVIVLILILVGIFVWQMLFASKPYYAVYMRTGDLYFGQLAKFPYFSLKNIYTIQVNAQNEQNPLSIQRFKNVFWGPEDKLKINREEVIWIAKLNPQGQMAQLIKTNPELLPPAQTQTQTPTTQPQIQVPAGQ